MKVTIVPTVIGVLVTVTQGFIQGLDNWEIRRRVGGLVWFSLMAHQSL